MPCNFKCQLRNNNFNFKDEKASEVKKGTVKIVGNEEYNGAIFIGLNSPVVKSHGGTDYIGFSNSLSVCDKIIRGNLIQKIKQNIN